jgi:hypothetical protein
MLELRQLAVSAKPAARLVRMALMLGATACLAGFISIGARAQQPTAEPRPPVAGAGRTGAIKSDETRGGWRGGCRRDLAQYCRGASGGRAKRDCLDANANKLSQACQAALVERRQSRAKVRQICRGDLQRLCANVVGGSGEKLRCLADKSAEVGPDCARALVSLGAAAPGRKDE